ncbi:MAG TPA: DUF1592 domain-containing protein [Bryobacteraceae bacterium]|jgi:hypothetical protein
MKAESKFIALIAGLFVVASLSGQTPSPVSEMVNTYCADCHNGTMRSPSNQLLDQFDSAHISANPDVWSRAYRQLQAGTMPPVGAPRPDRATYQAVAKSVEQALGGGAKATPDSDNQRIATRLAKLLWNAAPDAPLLQDAQHNKLGDPATLQRQVQRMLADDRAQAFVSRFFFPWLQLDKLGASDPDKKYFPDYDVSLRDALAKETELFLLSQLREDRDPVELWTADYTFLNEQLAKHYGVPHVSGAEFRRVSLAKPDHSTPERAGLLGQGSILMVTSPLHGSQGAYTSPASRGKWVRAHFLGVNPPMPFPNAKPVNPEFPTTGQVRVLPDNPCNSCHRNFFPLGYALENFDPLGRWRTRDQVGPVDASGTFVDGSPASGIVELRQVLLQRPDAFRTSITEKLLAYSPEAPTPSFNTTPQTLVRARQILNGMDKPRWSALIAAIVGTKPIE